MADPIHLRQTREATDDQRATYESPDAPDGQDVCTMYARSEFVEALGAFGVLTVGGENGVTAELTRSTKNYAVYDTENGAVTGLYISRDVLDVGEDEDAPESVSVLFQPSDEDAWDEALEAVAEEEAEAEEAAAEEAEQLIAAGSGETETDDSDDSEEVEVSDEELNID